MANTADEVTDLFAFKINYNTREQSIPGVENLYNGNISETYWRTESDGFTRMYGYQYDDLNRLLKGNYRKLGYSVTGNYDETLRYDKHGNITSLQRNGFADADFGTSVEIDNLVYAYEGNQLRNVVDMSNSLNGFRDNVNNGDGDYTYDVYGNMTRDNNKRIADIDYNHLNLPTVINFQNNGGRIRYTYNALGVKVRKEVDDMASGTTTTDYLDGFQYKNDALQFFPTAEGYVEFKEPGRFFYVYNYTDHLGNVRMSYTDNRAAVPKILEENHYYPFGLKHENYASERFERVKETNGELFVIQPTERREWQYKYQGQERQDELNLNWDSFKWRNYDFAIGRFMSVDPLAETYAYQSTYAFAENKVIDHRELEGLEGVHFTRVDNQGKTVHVIQKNVVVLTERTSEAYSNKKNARIERRNERRVESVKRELNEYYSDAKTESGQTALFEFNVFGVQVDDTTGGSETSSLRPMAIENGIVTPEGVAMAAIVTTGSTGGSKGKTKGNFKITHDNQDGTIAHEIGHTLLTEETTSEQSEHQTDGVMHTPGIPNKVNSKEVDKFINDSYEK